MTSTTSESIGLSGGLRVLASAIGETSRVRCEYIARRHGVTTAAAVQIDRLSRGARWCHDQGRLMDGMVERIGVFALVGLGSGFVSGLFGVGGGIVRIPLFVYLLPLFGVAHSVMMHVAVGTPWRWCCRARSPRRASSSRWAIWICRSSAPGPWAY